MIGYFQQWVFQLVFGDELERFTKGIGSSQSLLKKELKKSNLCNAQLARQAPQGRQIYENEAFKQKSTKAMAKLYLSQTGYHHWQRKVVCMRRVSRFKFRPFATVCKSHALLPVFTRLRVPGHVFVYVFTTICILEYKTGTGKRQENPDMTPQCLLYFGPLVAWPPSCWSAERTPPGVTSAPEHLLGGNPQATRTTSARRQMNASPSLSYAGQHPAPQAPKRWWEKTATKETAAGVQWCAAAVEDALILPDGEIVREQGQER